MTALVYSIDFLLFKIHWRLIWYTSLILTTMLFPFAVDIYTRRCE